MGADLDLGLTLGMRLDGFDFLMVGLVAGIGVAVFRYARTYFHEGDPVTGRFAATLLAFAGAMFGLVLADNLLALFLFWELTSITSFLLIGTNDDKAAARAGALQALLITGMGGLAMLGGFILLGEAAGTYSMSALLAHPPSGTLANWAGLVLVLIGALTKSAQVPFHSWLPGAMNAPTPVSAYLHSATMVKAGVYLVARFSPGLRRDRSVATHRRHRRARIDADRRLPGAAPARHQAGARLRHDQPARPDDGAVRRRHPRSHLRRLHPAGRPRSVQGLAVHGRRHRRPPDPHT